MKLYKVKVKDHEQNVTHTLTQWASSQNEANSIVLRILRNMLKHSRLEIV